MNHLVYKIVKPIFYSAKNNSVGRKAIFFAFTFRKLNKKFKNTFITAKYLTQNLNKFYVSNSKKTKGVQINDLFKKLEINIDDKGFMFSLDCFRNLDQNGRIIDNISVDYSKILYYSLNDYKNHYSNLESSDFTQNQLNLLDAIENLINREIDCLNNSNHPNKVKFIQYLNNIKNKKTGSFEEGLQRILFFNQLLWQNGHRLNGLGRLDKILNDLYIKDLQNNQINQENALNLIKEFLKTLHSYYWFKSATLMGDTGQVIVLGGKEEDGTYFYNDLTSLFIKAIKELQLPDPKVLLRISSKTPRFLIEESLECINTGVGCPLFSNDEEVISKMIDFGYDSEDAYNYVVSACWEPAAVGKGLEQNNIDFISYLKPLNDLFDSMSDKKLSKIDNFDLLFDLYKNRLKKEADNLIDTLNKIKWNEDPLLSLFIDDCNEKQLDISKGGAKYNHYGITTVSLASTVNSLYNLKKLVFEDKKYSLIELNNMRKNNFKDNEYVLNELKLNKIHFGIDDEEIINLTNDIIKYLEESFSNYNNSLEGKIKFGLSAPSYIDAGKSIKASFDGRKDFEPFSTHISSDGDDYTEIMHFASKIDYSGPKFNGNVVDLMVSPSFINDNFDKFVDFIMLSIKLGFFQMQMNVVDSDTLIKAKENPDLYPNLIVRVWGFSAYFNELPLDYQELLINRALKNESKLAI